LSSEGPLYFDFEHILNSSAHFASIVDADLHLWSFRFLSKLCADIFGKRKNRDSIFFVEVKNISQKFSFRRGVNSENMRDLGKV